MVLLKNCEKSLKKYFGYLFRYLPVKLRGAVEIYQVHSIAEKSQKKLWKATKTPTIKIHVEVERNIRTAAVSKINKFKFYIPSKIY